MKKDELESGIRSIIYSTLSEGKSYIYVKVDSYGNVQKFHPLDPKAIVFDKKNNIYIQKWSQVKDITIPADNVIEITKKGFPDVKN